MDVYEIIETNIKSYDFKANILGGAGIHDTNEYIQWLERVQ